MTLAFEVQHRVDNVLEHLWTGQAAVLGDVADEDGRDVLALRSEEELRSGLADLTDAAGRGLEFDGEHRLNRVDHRQRRLDACNLFEHAFDAGLRQKIQRSVAHTEAIAAALDLMLRFLPGRVQNGPDLARTVRGRLQKERGLPD